jgi:glycosyltransferase involved in cell wall biosynthesis
MDVKKVAIATWWHYHNYGSSLQATATYNVLKNLGYKPDVINYIPGGTTYPTNPDADREHEESWSKYPRIIDKKREEKFDEYLRRNLTFTSKAQDDEDLLELNDKYSAFVAGSDQIWAPRVFDPHYFLDFVSDNRKKIAYAPSIGLPTIENQYVKDRMRELLSQFGHISVREEQGADIIKNELGINRVDVMPDPTLLLSYEEWRKIIPKAKTIETEKYILCYFLGANENAWGHVKNIANQSGYKIIIIPELQKDDKHGKFINGVGPTEFFNLIDEAEMVLTDSFHGAIFSILTKTPFYVFERFKPESSGSQNSRVYNLLKITDLESRLISYNDITSKTYCFKVEFSKAHKVIAHERKRAIEYLHNSLTIGTPLVSVLVAVYNVEKYIKQCIESILMQTYKNLEIIIVNDGTPDNSGKIAEEYANKDKRVKVINKTNGGLSTARNVGIERASGRYIIFVDGDDVIAPDCVEYFLGLIEITKTDIARSNRRWEEWDDGVDIKDHFDIWSARDCKLRMLNWELKFEAWNSIWRRDFIENNHLRFNEEFLSTEGHLFNQLAVEKTIGVGIGYRRVWWYRSNPYSAVRHTDIPRWESSVRALYYMRDYSKIWDSKIEQAWRLHTWWGYCTIVRLIYAHNEEKKYSEALIKYKRLLRRRIIWALKSAESPERKRFYVKVFINPKKYLESVTKTIDNNIKKNDMVNPEKFPWQIKDTKKDVKPVSAFSSEEFNNIKNENSLLKAELASFLSVRRSTRLVLGNIKRHYSRGPLGRFKRTLRLRTRTRGIVKSIKYTPKKIRGYIKNHLIDIKVNLIVKKQLREGNKIPKVLHYIWVGGNPKPSSVDRFIASWKKYCPDYEIIEWNEDNYNIRHNRYTREAYDAKKWAFVTDYMRLDILDRYGGIYLDTDVEIIKNLDIFLKEPAFSSFETGDETRILLPTGLMGSNKGNNWINYLKTYYDDERSFYKPNGEIDDTPNTHTITEMTVNKYGIKLNDKLQKTADFTLYPHDYFCPKSWSTRKINLTKNSYAIHHFAGSWWSMETRNTIQKGEEL